MLFGGETFGSGIRPLSHFHKGSSKLDSDGSALALSDALVESLTASFRERLLAIETCQTSVLN